MWGKPLRFNSLKLIPLALVLSGGVSTSPLWAQTSDTHEAGAREFYVSANTLDAIVVTASRTQEHKREVTSNVTVIGEEDIKASSASTVADVLVQQGFFVVTTGDTSNVQIRGFGSLSMTTEYENSVLVLLNGRRTGTSNLVLAGLANVERIEIIRGPSAVQYGSSALGGVINIITKQGTEKPAGSLEIGLGSDGLTREKLALSGATNGFDYSFGVTNYKRDDLTMNDGERWYHSEVKHNTMLDLDLGYTFNENHRVGVNYYYGDVKSNLSGNNGGFRGDAWGSGPANAPETAYNKHAKRESNATLSYTGATQNKRFDWATSYSFGDYDQKGSSVNKNELDTKAFNVQGGYNGELASASVGLDYYKYDIRPDKTSFEKYAMKDLGLYATGKLRLLDDRLIFSAGVRHDWYTNSGNTLSSKKDSETTGSVGVAYLPVDWLKLRANYAEGFKMPSPTQITGGQWYQPNYSLGPEKSKTWELGVDVDWKQVNGSLTYFHSNWEDKILTMGFYPNTRFENLDAATLAGVEGSLSVDIGKAFQQSYSLKPYVSVTWLGTRKNKDASRRVSIGGKQNGTLPNTPEWMASYGLDYAHPVYKLKSRINANYYGRKYTQDWAYTGDWFKQNSGTVVNLSLEKELVDLSSRLGTVTLRAEVNNIFDGANEMYWSYPGAGRGFYLGLRVDF
jgi:vitamin B12 transporter